MICKFYLLQPLDANPTSHVYRNGYQGAGNGKWVSMMLKTPKKKGGKRKKDRMRQDDDEDEDEDDEDSDDDDDV